MKVLSAEARCRAGTLLFTTGERMAVNRRRAFASVLVRRQSRTGITPQRSFDYGEDETARASCSSPAQFCPQRRDDAPARTLFLAMHFGFAPARDARLRRCPMSIGWSIGCPIGVRNFLAKSADRLAFLTAFVIPL